MMLRTWYLALCLMMLAVHALSACAPGANSRFSATDPPTADPVDTTPLPACGIAGVRCCTGVQRCELGAVCTPEGFCEADADTNVTANLAFCGGEGEPCCPGSQPQCVAEGLCSAPESDFLCRGASSTCDATGYCRPKASVCDYGNCGECSADSRCGWCAASNTCLPGSLTGPTEASACGGDSWSYGANSCADAGCAASSCDSCLAKPGCGWCGNQLAGTCRPGSGTGPDAGFCNNGFWRGEAAACSATPESLGAACQPVGQACATNVECCGGASCRTKASGGLQCCTEMGQSCSSAAECCGAMTCSGGRCVGQAQGANCVNSRDCATGVCWEGKCDVSSQGSLPDLTDPGRPSDPIVPQF